MKGDGTDDLGLMLKSTLKRKLADAYQQIRDLKNGELDRTLSLRAELDSAKYMIEAARRDRDLWHTIADEALHEVVLLEAEIARLRTQRPLADAIEARVREVVVKITASFNVVPVLAERGPIPRGCSARREVDRVVEPVTPPITLPPVPPSLRRAAAGGETEPPEEIMPKPKRKTKPKPPKRFRRAGSGWGEKKPQRQICINVPVEEILEIDALATRAQMSRSHLVRQALRYFRAYLDDPTKHHKPEEVAGG